jgi:NitT/TauT family transport system substrate-binding protein
MNNLGIMAVLALVFGLEAEGVVVRLGHFPNVTHTQALVAHSMSRKQLGGDVQVIPTTNPDQLSLFQRGAIDAAWTVEPWISRLELEAKAKVYLEQNDAITTVLVCGVKFLKQRRDLAAKLVQANAELTDWINDHPTEAKKLVRAELAAEMKRHFSAELIEHA